MLPHTWYSLGIGTNHLACPNRPLTKLPSTQIKGAWWFWGAWGAWGAWGYEIGGGTPRGEASSTWSLNGKFSRHEPLESVTLQYVGFVCAKKFDTAWWSQTKNTMIFRPTTLVGFKNQMFVWALFDPTNEPILSSVFFSSILIVVVFDEGFSSRRDMSNAN